MSSTFFAVVIIAEMLSSRLHWQHSDASTLSGATTTLNNHNNKKQ
jgi:hypothetical protein